MIHYPLTGGAMDSDRSRFEDLQDRLLKLEKQNRRFKQLGASAVIVIASLVGMGQGPAKKTVEANEFILRDGSGNVRARLSVDVPVGAAPTYTGSPQLVLYDDKGMQGVKLEGGFMPGLTLYDSKGRGRANFLPLCFPLESTSLFIYN
jgi:hypothetical protein